LASCGDQGCGLGLINAQELGAAQLGFYLTLNKLLIINKVFIEHQ